MIFLVLFSLGCGLILSTVAVKFRDIMHLYGVFVTALMYLTPVIYALSLLPHWLYQVVRANPISNYLMMYRDVMLNGVIFDPIQFLIGVVEGVVMLLLGLYVFAKKQDSFILDL